MSLFTSGDNGTFDTTTDPNGNPPSDWNITKSADSIVEFNDTTPITGTGSMHCESRTIFNNDYGFKRQANTLFDNNAVFGSDQKHIKFSNVDISNFDFTSDFEISFDFYLTEDYTTDNAQNLFICYTDENNYIRINYGKTGASQGVNSLIEIGGVLYNNFISGALTPNQLYTIRLVFNQGVNFELFLNATSQNNTSGVSILSNYDQVLVQEINFGGTPNRPVRGVYKNVKLINGVTTKYEWKFNQEQGSQVFETVNQRFDDILVNYNTSQLQFGGGAWIDTTTL